MPLRSDFDGDGIADVAAYRPSTGMWYILLSSTGYTNYVSYHWGVTGEHGIDTRGTLDAKSQRPRVVASVP